MILNNDKINLLYYITEKSKLLVLQSFYKIINSIIKLLSIVKSLLIVQNKLFYYYLIFKK